MGFTLAGFTESQDSAALVNIAVVDDDHLTTSGDDLTVPGEYNQLMGYYFVGADFTLGQIVSPSLRTLVNIDVEPADEAAEPASPAAFHDVFERPIQLVTSELMNALMAEDAAGASRVSALVWLGNGITAIPPGRIFTVRATASVTLTANAWTSGSLTFTQSLPAGQYGVVGMRAQSAGLIAARLITPLSPWRPGVIGFDADGDLDVGRFRYGRAGLWIDFEHDAPPRGEFLSVSADTSEVLHLDLVQLRAGP